MQLKPRLATKKLKLACSKNVAFDDPEEDVRVRLAAKKLKLTCSKNVDSDDREEDVRDTYALELS